MYLQIDEGFVGHPKTRAFCGRMQDPNAAMYLIKLWTWAVRSAPAGDLSEMNAWSIEDVVGYRLADGKCYAAMVACGFIDEVEVGAPKAIHNWARRTGGDIVKMENEAERKRVLRAHRNNKCDPGSCPFHKRSGDVRTIVGPTSGDESDRGEGTAVGRPQDDPDQDKTRPVQARSGSGSGSDLSGPICSDQAQTPAPARSNRGAVSIDVTPVQPELRRWGAEEWFEAFRVSWLTYQQGSYGGRPNDFAAVGDLRDVLARLPSPEALAAQRRAPQMFAEFFADRSPKVAEARHPWSWFVQRFDGLRFPQKTVGARASPTGYAPLTGTKNYAEGAERFAKETA